MDSEQSINSFQTKKNAKSRDCLWEIFFLQFINNFSELLLCKIYFLTSLIWLIFFSFLLHRGVLKF